MTFQKMGIVRLKDSFPQLHALKKQNLKSTKSVDDINTGLRMIKEYKNEQTKPRK